MKTTNPKDYIELLEVFRIGLTNGLLDKQQIVSWADQIIKNDQEPDYFIIELSLCGSKSINDIVSLLNEYIGEEKPRVSGRVILGFMYHRLIVGQLSLKQVVTSVYWITWEGALSDTERSFLYCLDDDYDLAASKIYGTIEAVEKETLKVFELYKEFDLNSFNDWAQIDKAIDIRVQELEQEKERERKERIVQLERKSQKQWWQFWK